jgi:hypothetical protein
VSVAEAVEEFLKDCDVDGVDAVLAASARALAVQLDEACAAGSARGMSASPPLARLLVELLDRLGPAEEESAEVREMLAPLRHGGRKRRAA